MARDCAAAKRIVAVVTGDPHSAQRLSEEIPWFAPGLRVALFPDWETLPYDHFSPHQDLVSERLATLYRVSRGECDVVVVAATTALYRLAPPSYLAAFTFFLQQGERLDVERLRAQLALAGYAHVTQVVSPGEFSVRGGLIDLFPMGSPLPYRIDLFDNEIESIKTFDVDTQRTLYPVPTVRLLPAREFPLDDSGRTRFRSRYRELFEGDPSKSDLYKDISHGVVPGGIEYYLPLFFEATATLADYLPPHATVVLHGDVPGAIDRFWQDTESRWKLLRGDKARPLLPPTELFLPTGPVQRRDQAVRAHRIGAQRRLGPTAPLPPVQVDRRADDPLAALKRFLATTDARVAIVAESAGRRETMQQYFAEYGLRPALVDDFAAFARGSERVSLAAAPLASGFAWPKAKLAFVTEAELYANVVRRSARESARRSNVDAMVRDLSEVRIGDPVVHEQHGIGRYLGLVTLDLGDGANEFLQLVYANDAKLYVPGGEPAPDQPLQRRFAGRRAAARTGQRPMGQGQEEGGAAGARHRGRTPQPVRAARRAQGLRVRLQSARLRGVRRRLRLRGDRRPGRGHRGGHRRHDVRAADGPARLRRRRLRQDRGGAARRLGRASPTASRSRCWCPRRCLPSSTSRRSPTASPIRRCAWRSSRAFAAPRK